MKRNRIMWGFVVLVVLTTIAVSLGTLKSRSQQKPQPTPTQANNGGYYDLTKYAIVDYDAPEPAGVKEREERRLKSQRYDGQHWVMSNPHPDDGGVSRYDEDIPPLMIPAAESDLIIIGEIVGATAFLSNDKKSVYTEFNVCIEEILKEDALNKIIKGTCITADREGGYVRYGNGQKIIYRISGRDLPGAGRKYVFFLTNDKKSPNYAILTGYDVTENTFIPIDRDNRPGDFTGTDMSGFVEAIRGKISRSVKNKHSPNEKKQE